jgi:hypothetical protein
MSKPVKGFLAPDGKFFADKHECDRYVYQQQIESLCDTHNVHPDNFLSLINSWHETIRSYLDADRKCKTKQANGTDPTFEEVPQSDFDNEDVAIGDRDIPGFLEQQVRGYK